MDAARELLAGLVGQIDGLAEMFSPSTAVAEGLAAELSGDLAVLFAEAGELLARLIATLIAILEALVKALRSSSAQGPAATASAYQEISVAIGRDQR